MSPKKKLKVQNFPIFLLQSKRLAAIEQLSSAIGNELWTCKGMTFKVAHAGLKGKNSPAPRVLT